MRRGESSQYLQSALMDRFADAERGAGEDLYVGVDVTTLKRSVASDLERLLNTRIMPPPEAGEFENLTETRSSILNYGIPDLSTYSWTSSSDAAIVARAVEEAIRAFEPRLLAGSVKCQVVPQSDPGDFTMRLRIDAVLHVDPISERVRFDSAADIDGGGIRIESFE